MDPGSLNFLCGLQNSLSSSSCPIIFLFSAMSMLHSRWSMYLVSFLCLQILHPPVFLHLHRFHIIIHTLSPSLPAPAHTFLPSHFHISIGQHPTLTLQMPKPSQFATLHHLSPSLNNLNPVQNLTMSFKDTPYINLTIIHSVLSKLCNFTAHITVPYVNTLWTPALNIFSFMSGVLKVVLRGPAPVRGAQVTSPQNNP